MEVGQKVHDFESSLMVQVPQAEDDAVPRRESATNSNCEEYVE